MKIDTRIIRPLTKREKIMLSLLAVVLSVVSLYYIYSPKIETYLEKAKLLNGLKNRLLAEEEVLKNLKGENSTLENIMDYYNKKLPDDHQLSTFIIDVENIADGTAVNISSIEPEAPVVDQNLKKLPVNLIINGSLESIMNFLKKLEVYPRTLLIDKIGLNSSGDTSSWTLDIRVNLYYLPASKGFYHD